MLSYITYHTPYYFILKTNYIILQSMYSNSAHPSLFSLILILKIISTFYLNIAFSFNVLIISLDNL